MLFVSYFEMAIGACDLAASNPLLLVGIKVQITTLAESIIVCAEEEVGCEGGAAAGLREEVLRLADAADVPLHMV